MLRITPISYNAAGKIDMQLPLALLLVDRGQGNLCVQNSRAELLNQRIFLLNEQVPASIENGYAIGHIVGFPKTMLDQFLKTNIHHYDQGIFKQKLALPYVDMSTEKFGFLTPLIRHMDYEMTLDERSPLFMKCFTLFLSQVNREVEERGGSKDQDINMLSKLNDLIELHFTKEHEASFYAKKLGSTKRKLNDLTNRYFGNLVRELIMERIMQEAELMLKKGEETKVVAYRLGFSQQGHLDARFKKHRGMTSSKYRKMYYSE